MRKSSRKLEQLPLLDERNAMASKEDINKIFDEMASSLLSIVNSRLNEKKWKLAFWDVRAPKQRGSWIKKLRVELPDGALIRDPGSTADVDGLILDLWDIKDEVFPEKWYGFKLTIFPDSKHKTEFNHDPDCVNAADFYDVDEDLKKKAGMDKDKDKGKAKKKGK
jgi:hypothetical protein